MELKTVANHLLNLGKSLILILLPALIPFFLSEPIRRYYGYFIDVDRNTDRLFLLTNLLESKTMGLPKGTHAMAKAWASAVKSLQQEVVNFTNEYESWKYKAFFSKACLRHRIAVTAGLLLEKAELLERINMDADLQIPPPVFEEHDANDTVPGLEPLLDEALTYLQNPGSRVIGIYGVGGIGKTTLLIKINNFLASMPMPDQASNNNSQYQATRSYKFHHIIWATVSRDVNLEKLQKDIADRLGLFLPPKLSLQEKSNVIRNYMKDKNFLLLLDDLWAHLELKELGIPNPQDGGSQHWRKVVFTTRFENVCDSLQAMDSKKKRIKVAYLSEDHAWQLFRRMLGENFNDSDCEIGNLAKYMTKHCGGLPLALKVMGAAMSSRKGLEDWEDAVESLKESQPILGTEEGIFNILKHSYYYLNDDRMRECFLCCALWPEDWSIDKDKLIECWMGLGLLDRCRVGREYIQTLKAACLLEVGFNEEKEVKIHDLIRDMALQLASHKHKWMVRAGAGLKQAPRDLEQWTAVERVSLMDNSITTLPIFERVECSVEGLPIFPNLSTLMLQYNNLLKIPGNFFRYMPNLTYLDLSNSHFLLELPHEICNLFGLQYLNLSYTGIRSLPNEFGRLENLRYLFLRDTGFLKSEVIPGLMPRALQVLDLFASSIHWEAMGEKIFERLKKLEVLRITVRSAVMLQMLSKLSHIQLQSLEIENIHSLASLNINWSCQNHHLKDLAISELCNLKELKVDFGEEDGGGMAWNLRKLELLYLESLPELEKIIWRGVEAKNFLPRLQTLLINKCNKLEDISWVLQLQCLEYLAVGSCQKIKLLIDEIEIGEGTTDVAFPRLKKLRLEDLPNLQAIYGGGLAFPSLETIEVYYSPKLGRLPFRWPLTSSKMSIIRGRQEWWDSLRWSDQRIKTSLHTHFDPILDY